MYRFRRIDNSLLLNTVLSIVASRVLHLHAYSCAYMLKLKFCTRASQIFPFYNTCRYFSKYTPDGLFFSLRKPL